MWKAKRRKDLGLPPREKVFVLPKFNKDKVKQKVKSILYKYPIIPFFFLVLQLLFFLLVYLVSLNTISNDWEFLKNNNVRIRKDCKSLKIKNAEIKRMIRE